MSSKKQSMNKRKASLRKIQKRRSLRKPHVNKYAQEKAFLGDKEVERLRETGGFDITPFPDGHVVRSSRPSSRIAFVKYTDYDQSFMIHFRGPRKPQYYSSLAGYTPANKRERKELEAITALFGSVDIS